jgi:hypothetical protein
VLLSREWIGEMRHYSKTRHSGTVKTYPKADAGSEVDHRDLATSVECLDRLSKSFEASARRWELIVYPSLFAFIILAAYGFYLIYSLTNDVRFLALSVDRNMSTVANEMQRMSEDMDGLTVNVELMSAAVGSISTNVETLDPILANMDSLDHSIRTMAVSTGQMRPTWRL